MSESVLPGWIREAGGGGGGVPTSAFKQPWIEFDISATIDPDDPFNIQTAVFDAAGAQTIVVSFGTRLLPATAALFQEDQRVKIWRNGVMQSKGAGRDVYWLSNTRLAFTLRLRPNDVIALQT